MKVCFSGFDNPICINEGRITTLQITNQRLFARICYSLLSGKGENALEPYTLWNDNDEALSPQTTFIPIVDPFDLPIKHRSLGGKIPSKLYCEMLRDEDMRLDLQNHHAKIGSAINTLSMQFNANYAFALEWDLARYLKAFDFKLDISDDASLLDNLINFIDLGADMAIDEVLLFINLKTFLTKKELQQFIERAFFREIKVLLLENQHAIIYDDLESKTTVDQHFIEYSSIYQSDCSPSSQGRICFNGFGAVTF